MKILIVDYHVLFREGLLSLLDDQPDVTAVGEAGSVEEALAMTIEFDPDIVLMDTRLQNGHQPEIIKEIHNQKPETKIVVLTVNPSEETLIESIQSGAVGYLHKNMPISQLLMSLRAIQRGEVALSRKMMSHLVVELQRRGKTINNYDESFAALTPREREILQYLAENATNKEIAERLVISENTVKVHVHNILDKLDCINRHEAGRFARNLGENTTGNGS
jgi:two-component system NarL family response regulator